MSVAKRVLANLRVFSVGQSIGLALDEDDADDDPGDEPAAGFTALDDDEYDVDPRG